MKYTRKIERLAWVFEFAATYMRLTGCHAAHAFNLAERVAPDCWAIMSAGKAAEGRAACHGMD